VRCQEICREACLFRALWRVAKRRGLDLEVLALGGERMQAAGAELLADTSPMGAIGLWEALPLVVPTIRLQARVDRVLKERPPDGVVLIDYMGANVRLGPQPQRSSARCSNHLLHRSPGMGLAHWRGRHEKFACSSPIESWRFFLRKLSSMPVEALRSPG
jgi:hypothetical protein